MKKTMFIAVACLGFGIGFANAQTMDRVRVNLPYAARIGNVSLPAGEYSIRELKNSVIEITSEAHRGVNTFATVNQIVAPNHGMVDHTKVILRQDANGYRLQSIWLEGQDMGFELTSAE